MDNVYQQLQEPNSNLELSRDKIHLLERKNLNLAEENFRLEQDIDVLRLTFAKLEIDNESLGHINQVLQNQLQEYEANINALKNEIISLQVAVTQKTDDIKDLEQVLDDCLSCIGAKTETKTRRCEEASQQLVLHPSHSCDNIHGKRSELTISEKLKKKYIIKSRANSDLENVQESKSKHAVMGDKEEADD